MYGCNISDYFIAVFRITDYFMAEISLAMGVDGNGVGLIYKIKIIFCLM